MANKEIDLPLGDLVTPEEWGTEAFVYAPNSTEFYITREKHETLEFAAPKKFEAKVVVKDGKVIIPLPQEFAMVYFWKRDAQLVKIVNGVQTAIGVFSRPKLENAKTQEVSKDLKDTSTQK